MGNPALVSATNRSYTGFRLNYNQNTPPDGFEDKFYYSVTGDQETEEAYTYMGSVTVAGTTYMDYTGLTSGRCYHVRIYRYVNGVFNYATQTGYYVAVFQDILPVTANATEYLSFANSWSEHFFGYNSPKFYYRIPPMYKKSDEAMGDFMQIYDPVPRASLPFYVFMSKKVWSPDKRVTFEGKIRLSHAGGNFGLGEFHGFTLYLGERRYIGVYVKSETYVEVIASTGRYDEFGHHFDVGGLNGVNTCDGNPHSLKIEYDPIAGFIKVYFDDVLIYTSTAANGDSFPWDGPLYLWVAGGSFYYQRYIDIASPQVTYPDGECQIAGWADGNQIGTIWNVTTTSIRSAELPIFQFGTGITAKQDAWQDLADGSDALLLTDMVGQVWRTGDFQQKTPTITRRTGRAFGILTLLGKQTCGYIKVQVRNADTDALIPDSELHDNSVGFYPTLSKVLVNLNSISCDSIYLDITGNYDGTTLPLDYLCYPYEEWPIGVPSYLHSASITMLPIELVAGIGGEIKKIDGSEGGSKKRKVGPLWIE